MKYTSEIEAVTPVGLSTLERGYYEWGKGFSLAG